MCFYGWPNGPIVGDLLWYVWITDPGIMSDPVLIMTGIQPTQRIGAIQLGDGTNNILVVVGDGTKKSTVYVWCSNDCMGQSWTQMTTMGSVGWCTNAILLADGRPAFACSPQAATGAKFMVCSTTSGQGAWTATNLPNTTGVITNVYSLNLIAGGPAVVRVAPDGTSPGVYTHCASVDGSGTWTNVTPHAQFVGANCSKPTVAYGLPWVGMSFGFGVFRGTNATGIGAPWQMVGACAPGVSTFGPISAVVQWDGALTMGTASLQNAFYSVWSTDVNTVNVEELPPTNDTPQMWFVVCVAVSFGYYMGQICGGRRVYRRCRQHHHRRVHCDRVLFSACVPSGNDHPQHCRVPLIGPIHSWCTHGGA